MCVFLGSHSKRFLLLFIIVSRLVAIFENGNWNVGRTFFVAVVFQEWSPGYVAHFFIIPWFDCFFFIKKN